MSNSSPSKWGRAQKGHHTKGNAEHGCWPGVTQQVKRHPWVPHHDVTKAAEPRRSGVKAVVCQKIHKTNKYPDQNLTEK